MYCTGKVLLTFPLLLSLFSISLVMTDAGVTNTEPANAGSLWGWTKSFIPFLGNAATDTDTASGNKPDYLYSTPDTHRIARMEEHVYEAIKTYVNRMEERVELMLQYIEDYETSSVNMLEDATVEEKNYTVMANPLVTHRMIRRFAVDYVKILKDIEENKIEEDFLSSLKNANPESIPYPNVEEDYNTSIYSLHRIQQYSNLATEDMMEGSLGGLDTNITLSANHAYDIGIYLFEKLKQPALATSIEWLEAALQKAEEEEASEDFMNEIHENLTTVVKLHDEICTRPDWDWDMESCFAHTIVDRYGKDKPEGEEGKILRNWAAKMNQNYSKLRRKSLEYSGDVKRNFISTCSGEDLRDEVEKASFFCWYDSKKAPYLTIAPLKFELLSDFPPVYQIYDILTPRGSVMLINKATPTLFKSMVINYEDPKRNDVSDGRTSSQTWVYEDANDKAFTKLLRNLEKQIEYATGLNVINKDNGHRASEALQVAMYRPSQHYDEHIDAFIDERRTAKDGDRIATFMLYLSDVDVGGYTGFPTAGVGAKPVTGSGVFWHNLMRNGKEDKRTWHGGCPVIHGIKWVANKWILYNENWNKKPCTLDPDD